MTEECAQDLPDQRVRWFDTGMQGFGTGDVVDGVFFTAVRELGYRHFVSGGTGNTPSSVPFHAGVVAVLPGYDALASLHNAADGGGGYARIALRGSDSLCLISYYGTADSPTVQWTVVAQSDVQAALLHNRIRDAFPRKEASEEAVSVTFWSWGTNGASSVRRALSAPERKAVEENYPPAVSVALQALLAKQDQEAGVGGRLVLLHGKPGTGKTSFLRLLAREWRTWCEVHYVNDPEQFLGRAEYMTSVLIHDETPMFEAVASPRLRDGKWKLIILEDADEFLSVDAKDRSGQALQRLLNLGDGFLGQGAQALILLTTNEPVQKIHPAIVRPGRNMAEIEFAPFTNAEGNDWLLAHGAAPVSCQSGITLAELYERLARSKVTNVREQKAMGFV